MRLHIKLAYILLICNVILRVFTNKINILPKHLNIIDVGIVLVIFIVFLWHRTQTSHPFHYSSVFRRLVLFNTILFIGIVLNIDSFYPPAALAEIIMLNEPILLFIALINLPVALPQIGRFTRILRGLIIIELTIGILQVPIFVATGNSEAIVGTFFGNAEQYTGFLVLGICYYLGLSKVAPSMRQRYNVLIIAMLIIIPLVDNKASWIGVIVSLYYVISKQSKLRHGFLVRFQYFCIFMLLIGSGAIIATTVSSTLEKFEGLHDALQTGNLKDIGKVKAYYDIFSAFQDNIHMVFVGSGPGTFYSRASDQFYILSEDMYSNPLKYVDKIATKTSNSMGGVINPTYTVDPFYKRFYIDRKIHRIGSAQVDSPFSSYAGLLGETGFIGLIIYLSFYIGALRHLGAFLTRYRQDPNIFPLIMASLGFLIYIVTVSIYNPWLETGRMTTILWAMIGMVFQYEVHGGQQKAEVTNGRSSAASVYRAKPRNTAAVSG